jgi:hypothetical protein
MVDLDWGTTLDHLTGIMSNNVATKLFSNKSVLVLGPEYFPPPARGKKVLVLVSFGGECNVDSIESRAPQASVIESPATVVRSFPTSLCQWALPVWKPCPN